MSTALVALNPDLNRLRNDGYVVEVREGYLLVKEVPYVTAQRKVARGTLISTLALAGDRTVRPDTHTVFFVGEAPCDANGVEIEGIKHSVTGGTIAAGLKTSFMFSNKPADGYADYYEKMRRYADILSHPAELIDPAATPRTHGVTPATEDQSVFRFLDTSTSRAGITELNARLKLDRMAIIGLGGTGSYVLDLVAKTPVNEIHLFDGDRFLQHNAFRSPGAPCIDELRAGPSKVSYLKGIYSKMRRGIEAHEENVTGANVEALRIMGFVFICIDRSAPKRIIMDKLIEWDIPFIDVGMGVRLHEDGLAGQLRTTASSQNKHDHLETRISFVDDNEDDAYDQNIQIADLNCLNAALAVIKWKKLFGFYIDRDRENHSIYVIGNNGLVNEDRA